MPKTKIYNSKEDKEKVIEGIIANASMVAQTYGYTGHDVCIRLDGRNNITNDGVTVSNFIFFEDELKDLGSAMVRGITYNSDLSSSDGTTAAAILAKDIILQLKPYLIDKKYMSKVNNMLDVKLGMHKAVQEIEQSLARTKWEIEHSSEIYNVAYTATRDKELSTILTSAFEVIGKDGRILYKEKEGDGIDIEYRKGFNIPYGYYTPMLPNVLNEPLVLTYNERINSAEILTHFLKIALENKITDIAIIVKDGIADLVMQQIIKLQQSTEININVSVVVIEGNDTVVRRTMKDISTFTGSTLIDNSTISNLSLSHLGKVKNFNATDKMTTLIDGNFESQEYDDLIQELTKAYNNNRNEEDKESIRARIANLKGQVAIINIGGLSREKISNYKDKIKDAVGSIKNAIDEGVVKGGGIALLDIYKMKQWKKQSANPVITINNQDEKIGYDIVYNSLKAPVLQILKNSYITDKTLINEILYVKRLDYGYDAKNREFVNNIMNNGIIDPYLTVINSLKNAVEICSFFTNLEGFIIANSEVVE